MLIELLHSPGCGGAGKAERTIRAVVADLAADASVVARVRAQQPDQTQRWAGSPTVLIDGVDLEPGVEPHPGAG